MQKQSEKLLVEAVRPFKSADGWHSAGDRVELPTSVALELVNAGKAVVVEAAEAPAPAAPEAKPETVGKKKAAD